MNIIQAKEGKLLSWFGNLKRMGSNNYKNDNRVNFRSRRRKGSLQGKPHRRRCEEQRSVAEKIFLG